MVAVPEQLIKAFSEVDRKEIEGWWSGLSEGHQAEMATLCDKRAESCFFGIVADESELPQVVGGYTEEDEIKPVEDWELQYFEHLLAHPELVIVWSMTTRTFHTGCTAHAAARACWEASQVSRDFACPFGRADCLMKPIRGNRIEWLRTGLSLDRSHAIRIVLGSETQVHHK